MSAVEILHPTADLPMTSSGVAQPTEIEEKVEEPRRKGTGKIIAIANQKGGVGKTTTAINVSAALAQAGHRVLLIDLDPQANATSGLGVMPEAASGTCYDILVGRRAFIEGVHSTHLADLDLLPATPALAGAEVELVELSDRETVLKRRLARSIDAYEFVFIDCPPSLGLLTVNALVAAHSVLIPLQCEYYALEGIRHLLNTLSRIQEGLNPRLAVEGILLTMFDGRLNLSVQVAEEARRHFGTRVYSTMIPRNVRLGEAPSFGQPITVYDPTCTGSVSYRGLAKEIISHV